MVNTGETSMGGKHETHSVATLSDEYAMAQPESPKIRGVKHS